MQEPNPKIISDYTDSYRLSWRDLEYISSNWVYLSFDNRKIKLRI